MHSQLSASQLSKQEARRAFLEAEIASMQEALGDVDAESVVAKHIKLLHQYNEAKDATQILIGKLAARKELTVRQLHSDYGLTTDD